MPSATHATCPSGRINPAVGAATAPSTGSSHDAHAHPDYARGGICGIYYLQCAECTVDPPNGINRFYSPNTLDQNDVVDLAPAEGKLVLFPGHVRHAALPYTGTEDRIVISFNARLTEPR